MRHIIQVLLKRFNNIKFRNKIIITYIIIGAIPMTCIGLYSHQQSRTILINQEEDSLKDYLNQSVLALDNQVTIYNNLSNYIGHHKSIGQVVNSKYTSAYEAYERFYDVVEPVFSSLSYFNNAIQEITIYTDNEHLKNRGITISSLEDLERYSWYDRVMKSKNTGIEWIVDYADESAISVRRLPSMASIKNNNYEAILLIRISYDMLFESFVKMSRENYGLYIVDDDGMILFEHADFDVEHEAYYLSFSELTAQQQNVKGSYSIVNAELSEQNWHIWIYKPDALINHDIGPIVFAILVITTICIVASVIASVGISKVMVSNMENLSKVMKEVEQGNLDIAINSDARDEVGDLVRGFNRMVGEINLLITEKYQSQIQQKEAELKALQAQINPHFLYNSLSLINWKAIEADEEDISRLTLLLSSFYRTALNKGDNTLTVRDEIKNMQSYMDIQLMMHDHNFDVFVEVDEDIMECETLNLILQPVVENAIHHGIDMKTDGRGWIKVSGYKEAEDIILLVEDNGVGMEPEKAESILTKDSKSYGVRNVNERIQLFYGEEYRIKIESRVLEGTIVQIRMPAKKN